MDLLCKNPYAYLKSSNQIFIEAFVSKFGNKIYLNSGFGISIFNIDDNTVYHDMFFDISFEELYKNDFCYEESLLHKIVNF